MGRKWIDWNFWNDQQPIVEGHGITAIVSTYENPPFLRCSLAALAVQNPKIQVIVADNSRKYEKWRGLKDFRRWNYAISKGFNFNYVWTGEYEELAHSCYEPANALAPGCFGEWLAFPSDDFYVVPQWSRIVLETAAQHPDWEFIYWDTLYDPRRTGKYEVMEVKPNGGCIDKISFAVKRKRFVEMGGFPPREDDWRDGALAETLVEMKVPHGKAPGVLTAHN